MFDHNCYIASIAADLEMDIDRTIYDHFCRQLEEHFADCGALVVSAPKVGGDVFADDEFTKSMGDFVFESIEVNGDCEGLDIVRGHVTGKLGEAFADIGGLGFELWITTQGHVRHRFVDAERQVRAVWGEHALHELDDEELLEFQVRWDAAKAK